jgi:hypothetical protein
LIPVITQTGRLIVAYRRADLDPQAAHRFETQLHQQLRDLGRIIVEWTFNHLEPRDPKEMPNQLRFQGTWYRRRSKTPNRSVATVFGTITLWRRLYQDLQGIEPSVFPLCEPPAHRLHPKVILPPPHRSAKVLRQPPVAA